MSATTDPTASAALSRRRLRRRKLKAVLAAGIVLGVGAVATLAAFTDDEFTTATFTAGKFGIEGSVATDAIVADGTYSSHATAGTAAGLSFTAGGLFNNLLPGNTVFAPFTVRLDATTTTNGTLTLPDVAVGAGNPAGFTYGIKLVGTPALCNQAGYTASLLTQVVPDGTALNNASPAGTYSATLVKAAGVSVPITYCFAVTAGATVGQSQTATAVWHFQGTAIPVA